MTDFKVWLDKYHDKFMAYTYEEIADLAIACGFSRQEVSQWLIQQTEVV